MTKAKYTLPSGNVILLEQIDFGLYTISYNRKPIKEFICGVKAKAYLDKSITLALSLEANRTLRKAV